MENMDDCSISVYLNYSLLFLIFVLLVSYLICVLYIHIQKFAVLTMKSRHHLTFTCTVAVFRVSQTMHAVDYKLSKLMHAVDLEILYYVNIILLCVNAAIAARHYV